MTTQPMVRGYSFKQTALFLDRHFDEDLRRRLKEGLPAEVKAALAATKPADWLPRTHVTAVTRAIVSAKNDPVGSYQDLVQCGQFIATEATNTFLKLLMKILTPTLFAKKLPEFWERDQKGSGRFEVDLSKADEGTLRARLVGIQGYDHIGPISAGWMLFAMQAMGKKAIDVKVDGWSLQTPGPNEVGFEVTWS